MSPQSLRLRLGAFVALAFSGLTGLVFLFGGAPSVFSSRASYTILFPEAPGISTGTPVRKSGVRIGEVSKLDLDEASGEVRVHVLLDPQYLPRTSEEPTISRGLLSGDTSLDFVPKAMPDGKIMERGEAYPINATIPGVPPLNTRILLNRASGAIPNAQESVQRFLATMEKFEQITPKVGKALDEFAGMARAAREAIPELRQTNARVQDLLGAANQNPNDADPNAPPTLKAAIKEVIELLRAIRPAAEELRTVIKDSGPELGNTARSIRRTSDSVNDLLNPENRKAASAVLKNLQAASDDLTKTIRLAAILLDQGEKMVKNLNDRLTQAEGVMTNIGKVTKPLADNADQIATDAAEAVKAVNVAASELAKTLTEVRATIEKAGRADGTVQKLLSDPAVYNNLNDAAVSASRLLMRAENIAKDLSVFADKVARRPELIGVGGAVHPSSGLKESPTAPLPPSPLSPLPPSPTSGGLRPVPSDATGILTPIPPISREGIGPTTVPVPSFRPPLPANDRPLDLPPR